ncbi:MAG: hypothetical protein JO144_08275 [Actinobacteria bacterium]|nr:hypothetical protein [Actinomycetota bacterium]
MQHPFGSGSTVETTSLSWNMWYPLPFPPHNTTYRNEFGLHVHLSRADAANVANAFSAGAATLAALTGFGQVFTGLVSIAAQAAVSFVENGDGSMDLYFSTHGFQVGNAGAFDPTVVLPGLWAAVMGGLHQLAGNTRGVDPHTLAATPKPAGTMHVDATAEEAAPLPPGELVSVTPIEEEVAV